MPMTFLSHQAVVLPLKIGAPRAVSGTALVLGSMAPDFEYLLRGYPTSTIAHTWIGQVTFCLPVTLLLYWLTTRVIAEPTAAHLPEAGTFRLRDYRVIGDQPVFPARHWAIVAGSAVVGSSSHVLLDGITTWWFGMPYKALGASSLAIGSTLAFWAVLAVASLLLLRHIGRNRLLLRWAGLDPGVGSSSDSGLADGAAPGPSSRVNRATPRAPAAFWGWVLFAAVAGGVLGALFRRSGFFMHQIATWVHIWLCSVSGAFIGLVSASLAWHAARARRLQLRGGSQ